MKVVEGWSRLWSRTSPPLSPPTPCVQIPLFQPTNPQIQSQILHLHIPIYNLMGVYRILSRRQEIHLYQRVPWAWILCAKIRPVHCCRS